MPGFFLFGCWEIAVHRNKSVSAHQFAMVPRAEIPRASFKRDHTYKTAFDSGLLIPIYCEEVLPGDTARVKMTAFARLATPVFPLMDNLWLDSFFFFVPNRLVWDKWERFNGEQANPADSISFTIPQIVCPASGHGVSEIYDYFGLPTVGQVFAGATYTHSALPFRGYNLIWNEWFRDENLQNSESQVVNDGPDSEAVYRVRRRGKRHDYFTSCLPWPQKGGTAVSLPLTGNALVRTSAGAGVTGTQSPMLISNASGGGVPTLGRALGTDTGGLVDVSTTAAVQSAVGIYPNNLYADLSTATATTINALRQSFQIQRLLERDARGGTRYVEIIRSHFGVISPDARLQRPEYLGGGSTPVTLTPIAQTSGTAASGTTTPLGHLAAIGTLLAHGHGFSQSFTEHGYIIGLVSVRADLTYQQGLRRHWSRSTRYDFYWPVFAHLGEQAVLNKEIYCDGTGTDANVFGYQERWAEYRYIPGQVTGLMRSTSAGTLDAWHLAIRFASVPALNTTFIVDNPPVSRVIAVPSAKQFIFDAVFESTWARPMPLYSVPGLIDHF